MTFRYNYLPDVALADVAFEVKADSWSELFAGSAQALTEVMVNPADLRGLHSRPLQLDALSVEELLYDFLAEIVFLKDTEGVLVRSADLQVGRDATWHLRGHLKFDRIDRENQRLGQDVKAITYHLFEVGDEAGMYHAKIVLDI